MENVFFGFLVISQLVFAICLAVLCGKLLFDQYLNIEDMLFNYDLITNKLLENVSTYT